MYIVTGGAGFIGSNIVKGLNDRGITNILVVDNLYNSEKFRNLVGLHFSDYMDKREFLGYLKKYTLPDIEAIFHQGACSDTTERDGAYMMQNNYSYSCDVAEWCLTNKVPLVYASSASVYGKGKNGFSEDFANEAPINIYAYSKYLFDQWARERFDAATSTLVGLRYFNVYGPRETHKGKMASMAFHGYNQIKTAGKMRLFKGTDGIADGNQLRDFVFVDDVVSSALHFGLNKSEQPIRGVFNIGTGRARSFKDLATALIDTYDKEANIEYIPFPDELRGQYQNFTEANLDNLRSAGYTEEFTPLEKGIAKYVDWMKAELG